MSRLIAVFSLTAALACPLRESVPSPELVELSREPAVEAVKPSPRGHATARLESRSGSSTKGMAHLTASEEGVHVALKVEGATPGQRAVRVHAVGDCSASDAASAGPVFASDAHRRGQPQSEQGLLGDLANIGVGEDGVGELDIFVPGASLLEGHPFSFDGRALVVHADEGRDSDAGGGSGARIACGVIQRGW